MLIIPKVCRASHLYSKLQRSNIRCATCRPERRQQAAAAAARPKRYTCMHCRAIGITHTLPGASGSSRMPPKAAPEAALFAAAEAGSVDKFQQAAAALGDVNLKTLHDASGSNALHLAARAGHTELCKWLLDHAHFDVDAQDATGGAAQRAARGRRRRRSAGAAAAAAACPTQARLRASPAGKGSTALSLAIAGGHVATAEALLEHSPDVNRHGEGDAPSPLHLAVAGGHLQLAERLIAAGADVNAASSDGTPLELAAARSNAAAVKLLLGAGAAVDAASRKGVTPLFLATLLGTSPECVQLLVDAGADVNARAMGSFTPLHVAAEGGKTAIAEVLLKVPRDSALLFLLHFGCLGLCTNRAGAAGYAAGGIGRHDWQSPAAASAWCCCTMGMRC